MTEMLFADAIILQLDFDLRLNYTLGYSLCTHTLNVTTFNVQIQAVLKCIKADAQECDQNVSKNNECLNNLLIRHWSPIFCVRMKQIHSRGKY